MGAGQSPKLPVSYDRLLGQTSNLGRVEAVINFLSNEAKYTLSYKCFIY